MKFLGYDKYLTEPPDGYYPSLREPEEDEEEQNEEEEEDG